MSPSHSTSDPVAWANSRRCSKCLDPCTRGSPPRSWPSRGHCGHLQNQLADGRSFLPYNSDFQINQWIDQSTLQKKAQGKGAGKQSFCKVLRPPCPGILRDVWGDQGHAGSGGTRRLSDAAQAPGRLRLLRNCRPGQLSSPGGQTARCGG